MSMSDNELIVTEPTTGITFPQVVNDMVCVGCGVRTKFYINVYAVGTYIDKNETIVKSIIHQNNDNNDDDDNEENKEEKIFKIQQALCNPTILSRTIRIVTNWNIPQYLLTKGITDAIRPRLADKISIEEMSELEEKLHSLMTVTNVENTSDLNGTNQDIGVGTEVILIVKGDTMYYSDGPVCDIYINKENYERKIQHKEFCHMLCDVYYGNGAVSIDHRDNVIEGIIKIVNE